MEETLEELDENVTEQVEELVHLVLELVDSIWAWNVVWPQLNPVAHPFDELPVPLVELADQSVLSPVLRWRMKMLCV